MARNLDTALMRSFVLVAETGRATRAASVLHLTQGAVSRRINGWRRAWLRALPA